MYVISDHPSACIFSALMSHAMFRPSLFFRLRRRVGVRTNISQPAHKFVPKILDDTENGFAFKVLRSGKHYRLPLAEESIKERLKFIDDTIEENLVDIQWGEISESKLCKTFTKASLEAQSKGYLISDPRYNEMCAWIAKRCPEMTDLQLKEMLSALALWPTCSSPYEPSLMAVWKSIDSVLLSRYQDYKPEKILELANLWYQVHLFRKSDFVYKAINKVAKKPGRLMPHQVVLLLFYQNILRTLNKNISMFSIEERLAQIIESLSIEEIGVACMGFFKTQNPIHSNELADSILSKLLKNADTVPEITLASILKALRYQLPIPLWDRLPSVMDALEPQIERLSITGAVHIPLMLTSSQTLHEDILDSVAEKLIHNIDNARIKDMEKVLLPLTLLNYTPKTSQCVFKAVLDQLEMPNREEEFKTWPKCLVSIVQFFAIKGIFVDRLIDRVLDINFLRATYGKRNFPIAREILLIDGCVEFEHPSYSGNRLPTDVRNYLSKRYSSYLPDPKYKMSKHMKFEYEILQTLDRVTNSYFASKYVLPNHPRADHIVRISEDGGFAPLPDDFVNIENFSGPIRAPGDHFLAIVPLSRNMYIRNRDDLSGETLVKLRQLRMIGFKPVTVSDKTWPLQGTDDEKDKHLLEIIKSYNPTALSQ